MKLKYIHFLILSVLGMIYGSDTVVYSPIRSGYDTAIIGENTVFATDGGLVFLDRNFSTEVVGVGRGMFRTGIVRIEKDFRDMIWAGHKNCSFSVYDPVKQRSYYLDEIEQSGVYELNAIHSSGRYVYIATSGLLTRYRYNPNFNKYEIADTNMMTGNVYAVIVSSGKIYISTSSGVMYVDEDFPNINYLGNWLNVTGFDPGTVVRDFVVNGMSLFAITSNGLYGINDGEAYKTPLFSDMSLFSGEFCNGRIYVHTEQVGASVILSGADDFEGEYEVVYGIDETEAENFSFTVSENNIYTASKNGMSVFATSTGNETQLGFTNLPFGRGITKISITPCRNRILYMTPRNFSYYDLEKREFIEDIYVAAERNLGKNIFTAADGTVYTGSWSNGVNKFVWDGSNYNKTGNYSLSSAVDQSNSSYPYSVHPGIAEDSFGNIWISSYKNWDGENDPPLFRISPDGSVKDFGNQVFAEAYAVYIDESDRIWVGSSSQMFGRRQGLAVGQITENGLALKRIDLNDGVISLKMDRDDVLWIGTNNGIRYIDLKISPSNLMSLSVSNVNTLNSGPVGNFIYDVEVNSLNEKWFATDKGVSVLSADNSEWRHYVPRYFSEGQNVPGKIIKTDMPDEIITDIAIDDERGMAYFASENGLVFMEYGKVFKLNDLKKGEIGTRPSPFINDGVSVMGFIFPDDGNNYELARIYDMRGFLIRGGEGRDEFDIRSGWDGKDNRGNPARSGIYQIVAYSKNDRSKNITGKIAVVRK